MSFVTRDLVALLPRIKIASVLSNDEIVTRVRDAANWTGSAAPRYNIAGMPAGAGGKLAYAAEGAPDPYAGFEARIVPENITLLPKTASQVTGGNSWNEKIVAVKKGDSAISVLREVGASAEEAKALAYALGPRGRDGGLKEGQKLRILSLADRPALAAGARHRRRRKHCRGRGRALGYRQVRRRRRGEHQ